MLNHRAVRPALLLTVLLTALLMSPLPAGAGIGRWTPFGPGGGHLGFLVVDTAGVLFSAAGGDVYRSSDGGRSWQRSTRGLEKKGVASIAVDTSHPGTLYAGAVFPSAVYRSTDGGASWTLLFTAANNVFLQQIAVLPGGTPTLLIRDTERIFRSTDGGATFEQVLADVSGTRNLLVDPTDPQTVYLGTSDPDIPFARSSDGGATWVPLTAVGQANPLAIAPTSPTHTVYVSTEFGLQESSDRGETWEPAGPFQGQVGSLAVDPAVPTTLYATPENGFFGIFLSTDGGETWSAQGRGPQEQALSGLLPDPATGSVYVLSQRSIVYRSADHGQSWTAGTLQGVLGAPTAALVTAPSDPSVLYLELRDSGFGGDLLLRSMDDGGSWTEVANARIGPGTNLSALAVDRKHPLAVWVATDAGIFASTDGGDHWTFRGGPKGTSALETTSGGALLAGGCGVLRSRNGGRTWQQVLACIIPMGNPRDPDDDFGRTVTGLFVDPVHPDTVFAQAIEGSTPQNGRLALYLSQNGGTSWHLAAKRRLPVAASPQKPSTLYLLLPKGVLRSTDNGRSWTPAGSMGSDRGLGNLAVDAGSPQILLAAAGERGVLRSTNGGRTWTPFNTGLADFGRTCISFIWTRSTEPGRAWASSCQGGVLEIRSAAP